MNLAGHEFEDKDLVRRAISNMRLVTDNAYGMVRWAKIMRMFGVGSTVAHAMCAEFGFDPEQRVAK